MNRASRRHGRLRDGAGKDGRGCAERAEVEEADRGAVPIVARAPHGERFVKKRGEPQRDGEMNEERMIIQHGVKSGKHGGTPQKDSRRSRS